MALHFRAAVWPIYADRTIVCIAHMRLVVHTRIACTSQSPNTGTNYVMHVCLQHAAAKYGPAAAAAELTGAAAHSARNAQSL